MKKDEKKDVRTITFGGALAWLFAISFFANAVMMLVMGRFLISLLALIIGLAFFPPTNTLLRKHANVELSRGVRAAIIIGCFIAVAYLITQEPPPPPLPREVATTDELGLATLDIRGEEVTFALRDQITGEPLEGVAVALGIDPEEPWHALLAIADNAGAYPLQLVQLSGPESAYGIGDADQLFQDNGPIDLPIRPGDEPLMSGIMPTVSTSALASSPSHTPEDISQALPDVLEKLASLPTVSERFNEQSHFGMTTKRVDATDMAGQIVNDFDEAMSIKGQGSERVVEWLAEKVVGYPVPGMLNQFVNANAELVFTKMGATEYDIITLEAGPFHFKLYKPIFPEGTGPVFPPAPAEPLEVSVATPDGKPVNGGSFELVSKTTMGEGYVGVLDSQGRADIPVPIGEYTATARAPSIMPKRFELPVTKGGGKLPVIVQPKRPVSIELYTLPALASRSFLPKGAQRQVALIVRDAKGNILSKEEMAKMRCAYFVRNPLGAPVASISGGGLITIGSKQGAASVVARCDGVTSKPMLISGSGREEEPEPYVPPEPTTYDEPYVPPQPYVPPPADLPPGFPSDLPLGDYAVAMDLCTTYTGCVSQQVGTMRNTDTALFARQLTSVLQQWAAQVNTESDCSAAISYSPFDGYSFTATARAICRSGSAAAGMDMRFTVRKI